MTNRIQQVLESDRNAIAHRRMQLIELGKLLRQYSTGATSFSEPIETKGGVREVLHNGKGTGFCVRESLYNAVVNKVHPEQPKIAVENEQVYELTPEMLERDYPTVFQYVEDCVLYLMMMANLPADKVEMTVERTGYGELKYTFKEVQDGNDSAEDAAS